MARVLVGVSAFTRNKAIVLDATGEEVDRFLVNWRTPDDDESLSIQEGRYNVLKQLDDVRTGKSDAPAHELFGMIRKTKNDSAALVRQFFESVIDEEDCPDAERFEPGDLDRMLQDRRYAGALLKSLHEVASGDVQLGNLKTPVTSGKPAGSPALPESASSAPKKPRSSKGS